MKTKKAITTLARYAVAIPQNLFALIDRTHDPVSIKGTKYARYTWHGVPGKKCDLIIADCLLANSSETAVIEVSDQKHHTLPPALSDVVLEIGEKAGKYDHAIRRRYALRYFSRSAMADIPPAEIRIVPSDTELMLVITPKNGEAPIVDIFARLRGQLEQYDMSRIIGWHWRRYYRHLSDQDQVRQFADSWEAEVIASGEAASWTLAEANRAASRALYRLSRELGWRKLTLDERGRLGMLPDAGQWHHESSLHKYYLRLGNSTGCGEATIRAASGGQWDYGDADEELSMAEILELEFMEE